MDASLVAAHLASGDPTRVSLALDAYQDILFDLEPLPYPLPDGDALAAWPEGPPEHELDRFRRFWFDCLYTTRPTPAERGEQVGRALAHRLADGAIFSLCIQLKSSGPEAISAALRALGERNPSRASVEEVVEALLDGNATEVAATTAALHRWPEGPARTWAMGVYLVREMPW